MKLVISSTPLTETQKAVLANGPSFAVAPRNPPMVWTGVPSLKTIETKELRAYIYRVPRYSHAPKHNLIKKE